MRTNLALGALIGICATAFLFSSTAMSQRLARPTSFQGKLAAACKLPEEDVAKVLKALGPLVRDQLAAGLIVELPGLGKFRVVRVAGHKDLVNGRPANIPAVNTIEFLPVEEMEDAANARDAVPQEIVPAFEYNPLPNQAKGLKTPGSRAPNSRTR